MHSSGHQRSNTFSSRRLSVSLVNFQTALRRRSHTQNAAIIPALSATTFDERRPAGLSNLPTEILEQILGYCCGTEGSSTVCVQRKPNVPDFEPSELSTGQIRKKWIVHGYPRELLLVNRRISEVAFAQIFRETAFILSLSSTDALCFLRYALSERQRVALRCIRLTRFMLSWEDGVGDDIWLSERKRAPAFLAALALVPDAPRVNNLIAHLQSRHPSVQLIC